MTTTMMVTLGIILWFACGVSFLVGAGVSAHRTRDKFSVKTVVDHLQLKLITENDNRGFHTRTQVSSWLKKVGQEIADDLRPDN